MTSSKPSSGEVLRSPQVEPFDRGQPNSQQSWLHGLIPTAILRGKISKNPLTLVRQTKEHWRNTKALARRSIRQVLLQSIEQCWIHGLSQGSSGWTNRDIGGCRSAACLKIGHHIARRIRSR